MNEGVLLYRGNNDAEFRGPVNVREPTPAVFQTKAAGATLAARLFSTANDTVTVDLVARVSADEGEFATVLDVDEGDGLGWGEGDSAEVELDTGLIYPTTIAAGGTPSEVHISDALPSQVSKGNMVRRVAMATTGKYFCVDEIGSWKIGLKMIAVLDTMAEDTEATVDQVIPKSETQRCNLIRVDTAPASAISSGREIKNPVGGALVGEDFGTFGTPTSDPGDPKWGFRYPILPAHLELELGMHVRAEMIATDTAGIVARRNEFATVKLQE